MAWKPIRGQLLATQIGGRSELYDLACVAADGQSIWTDRLAGKLRQQLPELLEQLIEDVEIERQHSLTVLVQFHSNPNRYPYRNVDGARVGDVVAVWSLATGQIEFPTVVEMVPGMPANEDARRVPR
jgi:hypothetical protein